MNQELEVIVGRGRRITLPQELKFEEGDKLIFRDTKHGFLLQKKTMIELFYGIPIGYIGAKWFGIIVDSNGVIVSRVRSTSAQYLQHDLARPESQVEAKIVAFAKKPWKVILVFKEFPTEGVRLTAERIRKEFAEGRWPNAD